MLTLSFSITFICFDLVENNLFIIIIETLYYFLICTFWRQKLSRLNYAQYLTFSFFLRKNKLKYGETLHKLCINGSAAHFNR